MLLVVVVPVVVVVLVPATIPAADLGQFRWRQRLELPSRQDQLLHLA